jgi:aminobenzoyl-glutamate utilization protein B
MTLDACAKHVTRADIGEVLCEGVMDPSDQHVILPGSSEVGDVSHITPTGNMVTACFPHGTPGHSWQLTAAVGSGIGLKGMQFAAQTLATTALDLIEKPELLNRAKAEFAAATKDKPYQTPLPPEAKPR